MREQERFERQQFLEWQFAFVNDYAAPPTPPAKGIISEKEAMLYHIRKRDYDSYARMKQVATPPTAGKNLSWLRTRLGDEPVDVILVFNKSDHDHVQARYPESFIYMMAPRKTSK